MSSHILDDFVKKRERGADLLDRLAEVVDRFGLDEATGPPASDARGTGPSAYLRSTAQRVREGRFVVLLLGCFSSGKSTLLNALLGQPVLPVKVNPCTAILTELVYAETPSVTVHHHDKDPEILTMEAFLDLYQLRTTSEDEAGAEATDRFGGIDRAVVGYPLPLLRNGVVLLDTPGLDDDPVRTARTLSSLPDADAVIVVLSANRFLTDLERKTLRRELLPLGLTNLFFPTTMVDLLSLLSDDADAALADLRKKAREALGPLALVNGEDRFEERFFEIDARSALRARWNGKAGARRQPEDADAFAQSGLARFESTLERFLVDERGHAQLAHLHNTAVRIGDEVRRVAELDRATASESVEALRERQAELEPRFAELEVIARRVARTVDGFIDRQRALVWQDLREFMAKTEAELPYAVAEFDLGGLAGLDLVTQRGRARVEAQIRTQLEAWLEMRVTKWQASLKPRIENSLHDLRKELTADAADFDALSEQIVTNFAGGAFKLPGAPSDDERVDPVERWFSVAMGAVMLSPGAMAAGWSEGFDGALKGAASRLGVRLALITLGALLGPVGWAGLLLYVVSDAVWLVLTGGSQLKRLREQVALRLKGQLVQQVDEAREEVEERVAEGLRPVRDALVAAAEDEARELHALLERTISAREQAVRDAAARSEAWTEALETFESLTGELQSLTDREPPA
ncbi:MAG: dynamin family protein [Myxococcota bacterium]